jgi:hypothetical protein
MGTVIAVWAAAITTVGVVMQAGQVLTQAVARRYAGRSLDARPVSKGRGAAAAVSPEGPDR